MKESIKIKILRYSFNIFPAYRRTGGRVTFIAEDYSEIRIKLPLNWKTRNYVGALFGGSIYGAVDPIYMIMLIKMLGPEYVVWDRAATIRFKKPGKKTLFATFKIPENEIEEIKNRLKNSKAIDRIYTIALCDKSGLVHAEIEKVIYVAKKASPPED